MFGHGLGEQTRTRCHGHDITAQIFTMSIVNRSISLEMQNLFNSFNIKCKRLVDICIYNNSTVKSYIGFNVEGVEFYWPFQLLYCPGKNHLLVLIRFRSTSMRSDDATTKRRTAPEVEQPKRFYRINMTNPT